MTAPVVVLNNSRISGLADSAARQVEAVGFPMSRTGSYLSIYNVPVSTVFYDDAHRDAAQALMDTIPKIKEILPRSQAQIVASDPLILVVTRYWPAD
ncbi:LytR cell envelope-like transcriptional attenuator [Frankia torreyi]|uniref:LytR cell envelope-like transcriptional attenuator n=1 Tax=Frankia torreyi TaxID=1856 RepID=A0A0D8BBC5_9ACTN|nr:MULTISPECIES: LytR C-terminal domain-containing protein [Frankia]KJE21578.1 LytR cell envelope-like transcriptional attenuator [Frankia torreyi]KQM06700.1 LytR cell envelope-related transcriptional attenuator [Frankia sp. CpI1-P]